MVDHTIETERLQLINCTLPVLESLFKGDEALGKHLNVSVPKNWTEAGEPAFRWTYNKLQQPDVRKEWWTYLPVLKNGRILVGSGGYKGEPKNGMVEIGYEIASTHRRKGLATELAKALVQNAFAHPGVIKVQAHTLAEENESCSVLKKCGMSKVEEIDDPDDGRIWRWEIFK